MAGMHPVAGQIQEVAARTDGFGGTIGVAARHLRTGAEIMLNEDVIFPTASTFKTVLLYEVFRQVDAGKLDLSERITIQDRHRVPGSGVIQDLDAGAVLTLKDVATLMIVLSDNSATDIIFDRLGAEAIATAVRDLGMASTSLPLPTWNILAGLIDRGDDPDLTYAELKQTLKRVDPAWDCDALKETPDNDITTPRDYRNLYLAIHAGEGLSEAGRAGVLDILKRQSVSDRLPARLPLGVTAAHKTGSIKGVRNDGGLVYGHNGVEYAVAILTKGARDGTMASRLVADVSKLIYDHYASV
jgi:beta-lactamase class A